MTGLGVFSVSGVDTEINNSNGQINGDAGGILAVAGNDLAVTNTDNGQITSANGFGVFATAGNNIDLPHIAAPVAKLEPGALSPALGLDEA